MKTPEEDKKLKSLLKSVTLDSPGPNFTVRVMNRIFQEDSVIEKIKRERVLGKGFWMIVALFVILIAALVVVSTSGLVTGSETPGLLSEINTREVSEGYQSLFSKLGTAPVSIAGIFLALSVLLFIERLISSKRTSTPN
jgi:hypothetical protein